MNLGKIGFIGLGLIGGSIARKIKELHPDSTIIATAGHGQTIALAYQEGLIANDSLLPLSAFSDCGLIFLCAPVQKNLEYLEQLKDYIGEDCTITDVGSTKGDIHRKVGELGLDASFIGGHPMTGSEKTGLENANPSILVNAYYLITPTEATPESTVSEFRELVEAFGSIPLVLDCRTHDHATAAISHLPHMIAFSLVNLVRESDDDWGTMKTIAAGGFKDITRIASSSPVMWQNICSSNREQLLTLMDSYLDTLGELRSLIERSDHSRLLDFFGSARDYRDSIAVPDAPRRGTIHEIYLDLDDKAGELAIIASILGAKGISIKNIGIINNREFEEGVLRIEFYEEESRLAAVPLLESKNYRIYTREDNHSDN